MSAERPTWSARQPLAVGGFAILALLGGLGTWGLGVEIDGAVIAPGVVEVESDRQVIQHPDGGVVGEILARDGDTVQAGDILVRLDGTFLASELAIVERQLLELGARRARLTAEQDDAAAPDFGAIPNFDTVPEDAVREQVDGQRRLFEARRASLDSAQRQIGEQKAQIGQEIDGIEAELEARRREQALIERELADVQSLFDRGLVQVGRLLALEREAASLDGEIGRLIAAVAEARTRIAGLEIERLRQVDTRREEAIGRLRDIAVSETELQERRLSLTEQLARLDIRAPVSGTVFGSVVVAERSVVRPAEPIMFLVPGDRPLQIAARIDPVDIDQVRPGQTARVVFPAFNLRTTPDIDGTLLRVSPDAATDPATGAVYYEAIVVPDDASLSAAGDLQLVPGMPAEVFLRTEARTPLSYLARPLTVYFDRAFREE